VTDPSEYLERADRLEIRTNTNVLRGRVDDADVVAAVCRALAALPDPWAHPAGAVPIAKTRLDFYSGDHFVGNVGVASTFLTAQVAGGFLAYGLDDDGAVERAITSMVGLQPQRHSVSEMRISRPPRADQ
jgi:hypothetical protein